MKNISFWFLALSSWLLMSCVDIEERDDTATGNFEALWTILDEHYCFFDYKQKEYGLDWNEVHEKYKVRVNDNMSSTQLGTDYKIASGLRYRVLDDNIGYIRCASFESAIGEGNLDEALSYLLFCRGLIIDIRGNGGGDLTTAERLAGRFVQEKTLVGYMQHKTGT